MAHLSEYNNLQTKGQFYNCITIDSEQDFRNIFEDIRKSQSEYIFRAINEAKFKLYSSAQRLWIWNDLSNK